MNADDQYLFVVRPIENPDPTALGEASRSAPQKIVLQLLRTRVLEAEDLAALRIDAGHHVLDGTVLSCGIHSLKDDQESIAVVSIEQVLQLAQLLLVLGEELLVIIPGSVERFDTGRPVFHANGMVRSHPKRVAVQLHVRAASRG